MINKIVCQGKLPCFLPASYCPRSAGGGGGGGGEGGGGGYSRESLNKMSKFLLFAGAGAVVSNDICAYYIESDNTSLLFCVM